MPNTYYQRSIKIASILAVLGFLLVVFVADGSGSGYTFATKDGQGQAGLELKVDSKAVYNGILQPALSWELKDLVPGVDHFFNFNDIKPGDMGRHNISLHVKKNPAYVCLDFNNLQDFENGMNEPESIVDNLSSGELSKNLEFFAWRDDGDNVFEKNEKVIFGGNATETANILLSSTTYAVADANTGNSCAVNSTNYVGIIWCAGDLKVDLTTAKVNCDGSGLGNVIQTDSMTVDIALRAVQANSNQGFKCKKEIKPECKDKNGKKCEPKGNNGHGNDSDHNDDSNPGHSNNPDDYTDDDGVPPGQVNSEKFEKVKETKGLVEKLKDKVNQLRISFSGRNA